VLCLLIFIGAYGNHLHEDSEKDILILSGALLLTMGMHNSAVNTISDGKIKTSHLTGLFTDLGADLSEWLHPKTHNSPQVIQKIQLRLSTLSFYILGALVGGWLFTQIHFVTFHTIAIALFILIIFDIIAPNLRLKNNR
jgi:uncharacterized membrane protein YoaK (UPF0700 family)